MKSWLARSFRRLVAIGLFIFYSPAFSFIMQWTFLTMWGPIAIYAFLLYPWEPLLSFFDLLLGMSLSGSYNYRYMFFLPPPTTKMFMDYYFGEFYFLFKPNFLVPSYAVDILDGALNLFKDWSAFVGLVMFLAAFLHKTIAEKGVLITKGLYSVVRHPQYFGLILSTFGFTLKANNIMSGIAWLVMTGGYLMLASSEERRLEKEYGEEFPEFRERIPFIFPLFPSKISKTLRIPQCGYRRYLYVLSVFIVLIVLYVLPFHFYYLQ